ncbi:MAG: isochorismatase family protein [Opitutales bacterium]
MERQGDSTTDEVTATTVVVLLDLQPVFIEVVTNPEVLRRRNALLLEAASLFGMRVLLTEQVPDKLGGFDEELVALASNAPRFAKSAFSAFGAEGFTDALPAEGVDHLLLAGVETPICVYQTALDATRAGLKTTILTDCISCRRPTDDEWALRCLGNAGCNLLPVETVFYELLGEATNPLFRDFSRLVRKYDS